MHEHDKHEGLAIDFIRDRFRDGHRVASVRYRQTGHFSQRHHARTVATAIDEMIKSSDDEGIKSDVQPVTYCVKEINQ